MDKQVESYKGVKISANCKGGCGVKEKTGYKEKKCGKIIVYRTDQTLGGLWLEKNGKRVYIADKNGRMHLAELYC